VRKFSSRLIAAAAACLLGVAALAGCTQTNSDLSPSTASSLQASVRAVTVAAAAGDIAAATTALDQLQSQLLDASANGRLSADRSTRIQASIDLVRADLVAATPPPPAPTVTVTPTPAPAPTPTKSEDRKHDKHGKG
jgi:ribosomal protein S20